MTKILAIPGSLRGNSSSNQILPEIVALAPADIEIEIYNGLGSLPHFNDPQLTPEIVIEFKKRISRADAVLICTPEYAFGIPGSLKNALDWTVGSGEFVHKPVAVITASSQGEKGHAALLLVLTAISAQVISESCLVIPSVRAKLDESGKIRDDSLRTKLSQIVKTLAHNSD